MMLVVLMVLLLRLVMVYVHVGMRGVDVAYGEVGVGNGVS